MERRKAGVGQVGGRTECHLCYPQVTRRQKGAVGTAAEKGGEGWLGFTLGAGALLPSASCFPRKKDLTASARLFLNYLLGESWFRLRTIL